MVKFVCLYVGAHLNGRVLWCIGCLQSRSFVNCRFNVQHWCCCTKSLPDFPDWVGMFFFVLVFFSHFYFPASGQAVVTGVVPPPPRLFPSAFIAHRVQQSHCSSIFRQGHVMRCRALFIGFLRNVEIFMYRTCGLISYTYPLSRYWNRYLERAASAA